MVRWGGALIQGKCPYLDQARLLWQGRRYLAVSLPAAHTTTSQSSPAVRGGESSEGGGDLVFLEEAWEQEAERGSERARERGVRGEERGFEK